MSEIKIPGPSMGLNEIIDALTHEHIASREGKFSKYNPLRPSSAGKCERELGYEFMQFRGLAKYETEPNSASTHRLLNLGNAVERQLNYDMADAFRHAPTPVEIKYKQQTLSFFKFSDGTWLEGNIDGVIQSDKWKILIDIKSKGDKYSQFYKSSWDEFIEKLESTGYATRFGHTDAAFITDLEKFLACEQDVFFNNNLYQLNFYACNPFLTERGINLASIIQYNKNDSRLREIRFVPSQAVYEKTKQKFLDVQGLVDSGGLELTKKEYILGSQKCGFCPFRKECWPKDDAMKAYFKTLPPKQWAKDLDRLPQSVQEELEPLFSIYHKLVDMNQSLVKVEEDIVKVLDKAKVYKIRLNENQIYRMKRLKSGGPGDGPRLVLRRDKA